MPSHDDYASQLPQKGYIDPEFTKYKEHLSKFSPQTRAGIEEKTTSYGAQLEMSPEYFLGTDWKQGLQPMGPENTREGYLGAYTPPQGGITSGNTGKVEVSDYNRRKYINSPEGQRKLRSNQYDRAYMDNINIPATGGHEIIHKETEKNKERIGAVNETYYKHLSSKGQWQQFITDVGIYLEGSPYFLTEKPVGYPTKSGGSHPQGTRNLSSTFDEMISTLGTRLMKGNDAPGLKEIFAKYPDTYSWLNTVMSIRKRYDAPGMRDIDDLAPEEYFKAQLK